MFQMNIVNLKILLLVIVLLLSSSVVSAEVRAVWVRPLINADVETRRDPIKGIDYIRKDVERIAKAGLNTIYLEVLWDSYSIYPSRFVAQRPLSISYGVARKDAAGQTETWDPLRTYINEAKKFGIGVHAWLHVFHQWSTNLGAIEKSPVFSQYPEWAALDVKGSPLVVTEAEGVNREIFKVFMSPSNPMVRKWLRQVVSELTEIYPELGGIQWDYIRYPLQYTEAPFDYNPLTLESFKKDTGIDARAINQKGNTKEWETWQNWKARQVTEVVKDLGELVRARRPKWEISAAVFPAIEENLRLKQQDWMTWSEKGYVDALLPMLYSTNFSKVESWAKEFRRDVSKNTRIYPALFIGHFYKKDDGSLRTEYLNIQSQFRFDGYGVFASQSLTDDLIKKLSERNK
jgi:uncharacterized lipoprotein YddW (UPF0748 family)